VTVVLVGDASRGAAPQLQVTAVGRSRHHSFPAVLDQILFQSRNVGTNGVELI